MDIVSDGGPALLLKSVETDRTPRVWIGCLACYNSGSLVGEWFDAEDASSVEPKEIHAGTVEVESHEELWCFDVENIPLSREMSLQEATSWGEILTAVPQDNRDALDAWVKSGEYIAEGKGDLPAVADFEERFAGEWDSFSDFAHELADEIGLLSEVPVVLESYFNWEAWTRDLNFDYWTENSPNGGVFVFRLM